MKIPFPSVCFSDVFLTLKFDTLVSFTISIELSHFCLTFEDFCLGLIVSHGFRDPKRFGREEKQGLGTRQDLNQMSHRSVSGVLQNEPSTSAHLIDRCENVNVS